MMSFSLFCSLILGKGLARLQIAAISDVEWNSFNGMCHEEADFMAQLLKNCSVPTELQNNSHYASSYCPNHKSNMNVVGFYESSVYSSDETNTTSTHSFPQESSYGTSGGVFFPESYYSNVPHQFFITNDNVMTMDHHNNAMEGDNFLNQEVSNDSDESNKNSSEEIIEEKAKPSDMSKKRPRIPRDVQRSKRNNRTKKNVKSDDDNEERYSTSKYKTVLNRQSSMVSICSEDDCNASQELSEKTRASRGSATDPQSLYARKRRERINDRLKTLQSLVPNGTKVDISTMLEEAVQYVKFLQLQIKLLSSDEHWMYSPIAYNGMDIARFKNLDS